MSIPIPVCTLGANTYTCVYVWCQYIYEPKVPMYVGGCCNVPSPATTTAESACQIVRWSFKDVLLQIFVDFV